MAGQPITLVVNADDFGLSNGINRGIESAFHRGILRSASLMPNGQAFDDAVNVALRNPGLGVGVHLSLVGEKCIAPRESLGGLVGKSGDLPSSYGAFVKAYLLRRFGRKHIEAEVSAQIARVFDAGITPTHLDSHQHLHMLPGVLNVVLEAARRSGIPVVRVPLERVCPGGGVSCRGVQMWVLGLLCRTGRQKVRAAGIRCADHFWGLGTSGSMDEANLVGVLSRLRGGVNEIMCHPGESDPTTALRYQWNYHWDDEAAALASDAVRRIVEDRGIRLASFAG